MSVAQSPVLTERLWSNDASGLLLKRAILVIFGTAAIIAAAKIKIPMDPVPVTMQTFVILSIGAAYGLRLALITLGTYLAIGLMGFNVFTSSSAEFNGIAYMMANTGGYLVGFCLAAGLLGFLARREWDRSVVWMALAMIIGNVLIYVPGIAWLAYLNVAEKGWDWVLYWGAGYFVLTDVLKLAIAAVVFPAVWKLVGKART